MIRARGARYRARCFAVGEQTLAVGSCRRPLAADNSVRKAQSAVICRKSLNAVSEDAEIVRVPEFNPNKEGKFRMFYFGEDRILQMIERRTLWSEKDLEQGAEEGCQAIKSKLQEGNLQSIRVATGGLSLREELSLFHNVYLWQNSNKVRIGFSRSCYAFHLARWSQYVTASDLDGIRGRMDFLCNHAALSIWLGYKPAIDLSCWEVAHFVPAQEEKPGSLDTAHLNFCISLCNAQRVVQAIPVLTDPDNDPIYLTLSFPKDQAAVPLSALQQVLDKRIERSYVGNVVNNEEDTGGYYYSDLHASLFPYELLAYYRHFKQKNQLTEDAALHPMLAYFNQFEYDSSVESEPIFAEVKAFVENRRVR
jgi:hypothetical protein